MLTRKSLSFFLRIRKWPAHISVIHTYLNASPFLTQLIFCLWVIHPHHNWFLTLPQSKKKTYTHKTWDRCTKITSKNGEAVNPLRNLWLLWKRRSLTKKNPLSSRDAYLFSYATLESTLIVCVRSFPKIYPSREMIQLLTTSPAFSPVITVFPPTDYSPPNCLLSNCH